MSIWLWWVLRVTLGGGRRSTGVGMEFRLLGPLEAWHEGAPVLLGRAQTPKALCVLAVLLCAPTFVGTDELAQRVWGDRHTGTAARYKYIGWLRTELGRRDVVLRQVPGGYQLEVDPQDVDLHRFRGLAARVRTAVHQHAHESVVDLAGQALGLWRGPALSGIPGEWAARLGAALDRERLDIYEVSFYAELECGPRPDFLDRVSAWYSDHDTHEPAVRLLMRAHIIAGQPAAALEAYHAALTRIRRVLDAPVSQATHELAAQIQQTTRAPAPTHATPTPGVTRRPTPPTGPTPHQLPPVVRDFVGRHDHLTTLQAQIDPSGPPGSTRVVTIDGMAGVGKTTTAVYWAHHVAPRFPDGQLYLDLRGFDVGEPMPPDEAISSLLEALGHPRNRQPANQAARQGLYRSLVSGRRLLLVLDNARDDGHVRVLVPPEPGCLTLVTSRAQLTGLQTATQAHPIRLRPFSSDEGLELLSTRLGQVRVESEPDPAADIVTICGGLPLALSIAAAQAASMPQMPLADLRDQLRGHQLDSLTSGDPTTDPRSVFSCSYAHLTPSDQRVFRLIGIHPGPDISLHAAASLISSTPRAARAALARLCRLHLAIEPVRGRFMLHSLLRAYATELAATTDTHLDIRAAHQRALDHYLHTAQTAALLVNPSVSVEDVAPATGVVLAPLQTVTDANRWFDADHLVLLTAVTFAAHNEFDTHAAAIPPAIAMQLDKRGLWDDYVASHLTAITAAQRLTNPDLLAKAHGGAGRAFIQLSRFPEAYLHLHQAIDVYRQADNQAGVARTLMGLARASAHDHRIPDALTHARKALRLYRRLGRADGEADALNAVGWHSACLGDYHAGLRYCTRALRLQVQLASKLGEADAWDSIGYSHHHLADYPAAIHAYEKALHIWREYGHRYYEADTLTHLGDTLRACDDITGAHAMWRLAGDILTELQHPDIDAVRHRIEDHPIPAGHPDGGPAR